MVDKALENGSLFEGDGWKHIAPSLASNTLHLIGLLSDGGVHSRTDQVFAIIRGAVKHGAKSIRLHILTDGRDVPDGSSIPFTEELEGVLAEARAAGCDAKIASGGGRMGVTMDRYEADWNIVKRGWEAHVLGEAPHKFTDAVTAIKTLKVGSVVLSIYNMRLILQDLVIIDILFTELQKLDTEKPISDQWLDPFVIVDEEGKPVGTIEDGAFIILALFAAMKRWIQPLKLV